MKHLLHRAWQKQCSAGNNAQASIGKLLFMLGFLTSIPFAGWTGEPTTVAMTVAQWQPKQGASVEFKQMEGFPRGLMEVQHGDVGLKQVVFHDGTIEFDIKTTGGGMPGIRFRQADEDTAGEIYLRPGPDCPASQDCVQYAPVTHGAMLRSVAPFC